MNFYNEINPAAAQTLRELIEMNIISPGVVDERSIEDITPNELKQYTQCHFFAGIGIWSYALRKVGFPDDFPIWTGSCPCQPFSAAGEGKGFDDERHLWPAWDWLIEICKPNIILGEQVANQSGAAWFDLVSNDLEAKSYTCGKVVFPACSIGAPHIRQRQYWMAHSGGEGLQGGARGGLCGAQGQPGRHFAECGVDDLLAYASSNRRERERKAGAIEKRWKEGLEQSGELPKGFEGRSFANGFWQNAEWVGGIDGKFRPLEPGVSALVDGLTPRFLHCGDFSKTEIDTTAEARSERLKQFGNGIVAPQAMVFISAVFDYFREINFKP